MSAKTSESKLLRDDDLHHIDGKTVRDTGGLPDESGTIAPPETDSVRHARTGRIGELPGLPAWPGDMIGESGAEVSACGRYRYTLWRRWADGPLATFVMLNPSTADAHADDPTIRKCMGFARRWGMSGIWVVNLFALRSTDPAGLLDAPDPIGPENNDWVRAAIEYDRPVFAWGATGGARVAKLVASRTVRILEIAREAEGADEPMCLGRTKNGHPRHPLMLAYSTPLDRFEVPHG